MPRMTLAALAVAIIAFSSPADAKPKRLKVASVPQTSSCGMDRGVSLCPGIQTEPMGRRPGTAAINGYDMAQGVVGGRPTGCPHRYCGCSVSLKVFGRIIPELNLAFNWRKFPRANPAAGMVAYRSGHVFYIQSVIDSSTVVAFDPNSGGGRTRIHTVSLHRYRVVDPHGNRFAQLN